MAGVGQGTFSQVGSYPMRFEDGTQIIATTPSATRERDGPARMVREGIRGHRASNPSSHARTLNGSSATGGGRSANRAPYRIGLALG